jgi:hypothetical protein
MMLILLSATPAVAWDEDNKLQIQFGAYTHFGGDDDEYEGPPILFNFEAIRPDNFVYGLSLFNNSFGQFSQYAYIGKRWNLPKIYKHLNVKLTGGILHGYKDPYEDKVPLNHNGWSPGMVPSIGIQKGRFAIDLVVFGTAGMMLSFGYNVID